MASSGWAIGSAISPVSAVASAAAEVICTSGCRRMSTVATAKLTAMTIASMSPIERSVPVRVDDHDHRAPHRDAHGQPRARRNPLVQEQPAQAPATYGPGT